MKRAEPYKQGVSAIFMVRVKGTKPPLNNAHPRIAKHWTKTLFFPHLHKCALRRTGLNRLSTVQSGGLIGGLRGSTMKVTIKETREADVVYLQADCGVRYWEDAHVNGVEDAEGTLIPCRVEDRWKPVIDLEAGKIEGWAQGTEARLHYKVCDDGVYTLLDADRRPVKEFDGYVPKMMCPAGAGFGDYVIMNIGPDGTIENWHADLTPFMAVTT